MSSFFLFPVFSFALDVKFDAKAKLDSIKNSKPITKIKSLKKPKKEITYPKMVETVEQWREESKDIPIEQRKNYKKDEPQDKKYYVPNPTYRFERYNYPQGTRELNIEDIKKNLYSYPYYVADNSIHYIAYPRYYFFPEDNQISSEFYVEKLDMTKNKTRRILEYDHNAKKRIPIIDAGVKQYYKNLYRGLVLVDWSRDNKKLLIKEKVGSTLGGIYKTYLYVHFLSADEAPKDDSYTIKLNNLDNAIKNYYLDWQNTQLVKYRYDIEPLGFSYENDDVVVVLSYVLDKNNNKIFLGTWGYNIKTNETILMSKTNYSPNITINGLILRQTND